MRRWRTCIPVLLGAGLLASAQRLWPARRQVRPAPVPAVKRMAARPGDSPSVAACRSALACWSRAEARANRQREALEEWDPAAAERLNPEAWRRRLLAADPAGDLLRARRLAHQAWVLASTPGERWSAACLEAYLAYDADDRPAQLRVARRLTALRPGSREALLANLRARAGRRASASLAAWGGARGSLSRG